MGRDRVSESVKGIRVSESVKGIRVRVSVKGTKEVCGERYLSSVLCGRSVAKTQARRAKEEAHT